MLLHTLSFSDASKQLFISQSAVSQSIKTLERKLEPASFYPEHKEGTADCCRVKFCSKHIEPAMNLIRQW